MSTGEQPAPVLVAVDGSGRSAGAVRYAVREARLRGSTVRIVHVAPTTLPQGGFWPSVDWDVEDLRSSGERVLDRAVSRTSTSAPDVEVDSQLYRGPRVGELARASAEGALLVLGRETRHGLERLVTGATTAGVVARAVVPVLVVRADWQEDGTTGLVVGVRSYPGDGELLAHAYAAAAVRHATLRLVQVADAGDLAPDAVEGADVDAAVAAGNRMLGEAVRDWSADTGIDLLVGLSLGRDTSEMSVLDALRTRFSEFFPGPRIRGSRANLVVCHQRIARYTVARFARRHGLPLLVWTVDDPDALAYWLTQDVSWLVTTNYPERAIGLRQTVQGQTT